VNIRDINIYNKTISVCLTISVCSFKGAMCNKVEYLLTEMQYDIHNYVFSGV